MNGVFAIAIAITLIIVFAILVVSFATIVTYIASMLEKYFGDNTPKLLNEHEPLIK